MEASLAVGDVVLTDYFVLVFLASGLSKMLRPGARPLGGRRVARVTGGAEAGLGLLLTQLWIAHAAVVGIVLVALILLLPIRVLSHRRIQSRGCFGQLTPEVREGSSALTGLFWIALAAVLFVITRSPVPLRRRCSFTPSRPLLGAPTLRRS